MQSITANLSDMAFRGIDDNFSVPFSQASKQASKQAFIFNKGLLQSAAEDCGITQKQNKSQLQSLFHLHQYTGKLCLSVYFFSSKSYKHLRIA